MEEDFETLEDEPESMDDSELEENEGKVQETSKKIISKRYEPPKKAAIIPTKMVPSQPRMPEKPKGAAPPG